MSIRQKSIKYLGALIDSTLSWKDHIFNTTKKLSRAIGILYKLRPFVTTKIMINIYYALIYSHLVYAIEVWGSACVTHITKILTLQKRSVRLITYKDQFPSIPGPLYPSAPLFLKLSFLKVEDIFILQVSKFVHKCINFDIINNFDNWFKLNHEVHSHSTRTTYNSILLENTNNLSIPFGRTTNYGLKLIKVSGPKLWNSLPLDIRNLKSLSNFKASVKNHLLVKYEN